MNNQNNNQQNNNNQNNNQNRNPQHNPQNNQQNKNTPVGNGGASWGWQKIGGIILLILIVIILARMDRGEKTPQDATPVVVVGCEDGALFNTETGEPCEGAVLPEAPVAQAPAPSDELSFDDAKATYASSTIILGDDCSVASNAFSFSAPARVLVTNEGTAESAIVLGTRSVTLAPLRYATSFLRDAGEYPFSCNGEVVATVTVN